MGKRRNNLIILAIVLALLGVSLYVIFDKKTALGLDLQGGTELVYQARPTPQVPEVSPEDVDRAIEIIRERVDSLGVSEPEISRVGADQIDVALPNVSSAERATEQIGTTAKLYLYDFEPNVIPPNPDIANPEDRPYNRLIDAVEAASKQPEVSDEQCERQGCTTGGDTYYLFDSDTLQPIGEPSEVRNDLFVNFDDGAQPENTRVIAVPQGTVVLESAPDDDPATEDVDESTAPSQYFVLEDRPSLAGDEITDPKPGTDQFQQPTVDFNFTDSGREAFAEVTAQIAQRGADDCFAATGSPCGGIAAADAEQFAGSFAIVLDGELVSKPIINFVDNPTGIDGRTGAQISGVTAQEAADLSEVLKIGALPINLALISQSTVSATLGQQALDQGLKAGLIGLAIVLCFLIFYYRFLGVIAGLGLVVYAIYYFALIKALPITVTLPGIAGLVLTIGVAADSNIVIFERIKEEVRAGRSMLSAISEGYRKGIATIVDANVITLLTAFILFGLATAGVKGFAFTLGIGTIVSLFTAVLFTRAILGLLGRSFLRSPAFLGASGEGKQWRFDFTRASKWFFSMSGVILAIGAIAFATAQLNLGIDFESGTRIQAALAEPATADEVRDALSEAGIEDSGAAKIQEAENPEFGANVIQISAQIPPDQVIEVQSALEDSFGLESGEASFDSQSVGPTFGEQVANKAMIAIIFSLLVISAYVAIRFEAKYAVPVLIALVHDILITAGIYALVGAEVSSGTVAAFLTILGYSMYDTIIVFDRVRENVPRMPRAAFSQIVNRSMSEVLTRSLITGLSTVFLIGTLLVFGGDTLRDFALAMMIGVASGTYSSIFIAAPVLTEWKEREPAYRSRRERIVEAMGRVPTFPEDNVVSRIDEVERHLAGEDGEPPVVDGGATPREPAPAAAPAPVAIAEPPVERAAPVEPTAEEAGEGVAGRPGANAERTKPAASRKKQSRRRRKHGRSR